MLCPGLHVFRREAEPVGNVEAVEPFVACAVLEALVVTRIEVETSVEDHRSGVGSVAGTDEGVALVLEGDSLLTIRGAG